MTTHKFHQNWIKQFQSTLPRREWQYKAIEGITVPCDFNPHSHEGSDKANTSRLMTRGDFNPHSHEGSDAFKRGLEEYKRISIHTPTKGVTPNPRSVEAAMSISIHTPTKGVTVNSTIPFWLMRFQSTLPRREWRNISQDKRGVKKYFNPHSHEGSDLESNESNIR